MDERIQQRGQRERYICDEVCECCDRVDHNGVLGVLQGRGGYVIKDASFFDEDLQT